MSCAAGDGVRFGEGGNSHRQSHKQVYMLWQEHNLLNGEAQNGHQPLRIQNTYGPLFFIS